MLTRCIISVTAFLFVFGCNPATESEVPSSVSTPEPEKRLYSQAVGDSFTIFTSLPGDYQENIKNKYPVIFLLDANLYFEMMAAILSRYAEVGLAPPVILIGIGYRDFMLMDSLRNRDDTYPVAIPEYEMSVSGGADKFLAFIDNELIPYIDREYRTVAGSKTLIGHSLAGYFASYALHHNLAGQKTGLDNYIAASPSLHYNNYYLLNELKSLPQTARKEIKTYITYGGLEETSPDTPGLTQKDVLQKLQDILGSRITYKADVYSNLDHMDTQIPTFIKGIQLLLMDQK
jgi:uncharacterized protein